MVEIIERLLKRALEIEILAKQYPSWNISDAKQHANDIRYAVDFINNHGS